MSSSAPLPLVSAIVLCYNTGSYVVKTLGSLINNGYPNLEIVCIDDGSTDLESGKELRAFADSTDSVRLITNPINMGITRSLNLAIQHVSGEFLLLLGDDIILPGKIKRDVEEFSKSKPNTGVVFSILQHMGEDETLFPSFSPSFSFPDTIPSEPSREEVIAGGGLVTTPTAMIRKSAVLNVGGWDTRISWEDKQMWFKLFHAGYSFKFRAEVTTLYRRRTDSVSSRFRTGDLLGQMLCYSKYSDSPAARREMRRIILMAATAQLMGVNDLENCLQEYREARKYNRLLFAAGRLGLLSLGARVLTKMRAARLWWKTKTSIFGMRG